MFNTIATSFMDMLETTSFCVGTRQSQMRHQTLPILTMYHHPRQCHRDLSIVKRKHGRCSSRRRRMSIRESHVRTNQRLHIIDIYIYIHIYHLYIIDRSSIVVRHRSEDIERPGSFFCVYRNKQYDNMYTKRCVFRAPYDLPRETTNK